MSRLGRNRPGARALAALAVAGTGLVIATTVQAQIPGAGVIHGCYGKPGTPQRGELRVRDDLEQCRSYENQLDWSQTGPTGPAGPSDTYYASGQAVAGNGGAATVVASIAVPPGNYLVSATGWATPACAPGAVGCPVGRAEVRCGIDGFNSPRDDDFFSVSPNDNLHVTMAVHGGVALPSGGTVSVQCQSDQVLVSAQLTATAVGKLHGPVLG